MKAQNVEMNVDLNSLSNLYRDDRLCRICSMKERSTCHENRNPIAIPVKAKDEICKKKSRVTSKVK